MFQKTIRIVSSKSTIVGSSVILLFLLFANKVSANWVMPAAPPGVPNDFETSISNLTNWILGFVAMVAVLAIIWGGVTYVGSAGDENKATTGKRVITYALIGLVIAGMAYAIVNVIVTTILV